MLTPVEGTLPSDARIVVTIDGENETYRPIQSGVFIIALGNVRNMETDLQVQLVSDMFPVAAAYYTLQAKMYLSQSDAESAALNGTALPQTAALRFSNTRYNTGVTIREASDQRIFNVGQSISVSVTTKPETLPAGYNVEVQLHQQFPNGLYGNTAIRPTGEYTFSLADMVAGNYCIVATLSDSNGYVVNEARYYFILQEQE